MDNSTLNVNLEKPKSWYDDISLSVVIVLMIVLFIIYSKAVQHDIKFIKARKARKDERRIKEFIQRQYQDMKNIAQNNQKGQTIDSIPYLSLDHAIERERIKFLIDEVLDERKAQKLHVRRLYESSRDALIIGGLAGAIAGTSIISSALTWALVKGIFEGITMYL